MKHRTMGHARLMTVASGRLVVAQRKDALFGPSVHSKDEVAWYLRNSAIEQTLLMNWLRQCGLNTGEYWTTLNKEHRGKGTWVTLTSVASKRSG